ncbi:hypothetical protein Y032_0460g1855 [Ancylostoma ceylanicum]|uniref:Uncharacterized protein n=1 Tax=Ancylostoma ceylanicum TaxID=53326 RepID=A0A016WYX3_9BILA|nr:hypothetical protein Y032_0460g1855 [Ancylostoma ceylanicum]
MSTPWPPCMSNPSFSENRNCLSNNAMDWLRGRMFFGGGSSNASSADDEERRLVEQPSTSSTRVNLFSVLLWILFSYTLSLLSFTVSLPV